MWSRPLWFASPVEDVLEKAHERSAVVLVEDCACTVELRPSCPVTIVCRPSADARPGSAARASERASDMGESPRPTRSAKLQSSDMSTTTTTYDKKRGRLRKSSRSWCDEELINQRDKLSSVSSLVTGDESGSKAAAKTRPAAGQAGGRLSRLFATGEEQDEDEDDMPDIEDAEESRWMEDKDVPAAHARYFAAYSSKPFKFANNARMRKIGVDYKIVGTWTAAA
ncbi:hypothetical protein T492DRAFT_844631 [Pavlovales sp. CCMP2436]|nr:hypothetical protein T492DRAFT_844631 [Pavlovales sp. CCMP2436]